MRRFAEEVAVDDVSLTVEAGEIHALVGLNGAGKTTLMRLVLGMLAPDAGRVRIAGHDVRDAPAALWRQVGHLVETPFAYPELTTRENLVAVARLRGMGVAAAREAAATTVAELLLDRWADRPARVLSLGNRQRLGLGCAIVHRPRILVLDEPTNALDPAGVVAVRSLLRRLAEEDGAAVLVSSHHLDEVARVAHRISALHDGRVVGAIDPGGVDLERRFFDLVYAHVDGAGGRP